MTHSKQEDMQIDHVSDDTMSQIKASGGVVISPELFEKIYLTRGIQAAQAKPAREYGDVGAIGLVGFVIGVMPLACNLMDWRGSGRSSAVYVGLLLFFGGTLQVLSGLGHWFNGNSLPSVIHLTYAAFFWSHGVTQMPQFNAWGAYAPAGEDPTAGLSSTPYNAAYGFFYLWMGVLTFMFLVASLRTNIAFVVVLFTLDIAFALLVAAVWLVADGGDGDVINRCLTAAGAFAFVSSGSGVWLLFSALLSIAKSPFSIPVGDLSGAGAAPAPEASDEKANETDKHLV